MDIYLFNSLTRKKERFVPIKDKKVNLFVCGPTVYDYSHLGHAKTYTQFDFLARYLKYLGFNVFYLQNITDLDDKILKRAKELKVPRGRLTEKYEKLYIEDMKKLNNTSVSKYARATDYIAQIIKQVETLMKKGYAYTIDDGIYFEISKFPDYGKLSGRTELKKDDSVSRIDENSQKRGWNDFCLWKFSKPGEPSWKVEMGDGRPGWHIEDTAITETFFGPQYDIHGGAVDLIIPHHEAEIAQMEAASGKKPLVRYWLHTAFLMVDGGKMSKSLGNFYTVDNVIKKGFDPLALRYLFLGAHYRDTLNFTWESLNASKTALSKLRNIMQLLKKEKERMTLSPEKAQQIEEFRDEFLKAIGNDLNTPQALAILWNMLKSNIPGQDKYDLAMSFDEILGLQLNKVTKRQEMPSEVKDLIKKRDGLRKEGKFGEADELRSKIYELGYKIEDTARGQEVKKD
ncbi:MAG: cysteine--tRNA ligase [bacterium]|nr:cysteine--tRNA ligase [bacterium]